MAPATSIPLVIKGKGPSHRLSFTSNWLGLCYLATLTCSCLYNGGPAMEKGAERVLNVSIQKLLS